MRRSDPARHPQPARHARAKEPDRTGRHRRSPVADALSPWQTLEAQASAPRCVVILVGVGRIATAGPSSSLPRTTYSYRARGRRSRQCRRARRQRRPQRAAVSARAHHLCRRTRCCRCSTPSAKKATAHLSDYDWGTRLRSIHGPGQGAHPCTPRAPCVPVWKEHQAVEGPRAEHVLNHGNGRRHRPEGDRHHHHRRLLRAVPPGTWPTRSRPSACSTPTPPRTPRCKTSPRCSMPSRRSTAARSWSRSSRPPATASTWCRGSGRRHQGVAQRTTTCSPRSAARLDTPRTRTSWPSSSVLCTSPAARPPRTQAYQPTSFRTAGPLLRQHRRDWSARSSTSR